MSKDRRPLRPAAAAEITDAESGMEEEDSPRRSLYALDVMLKRGLIDQAEYDRRRADLVEGG
jgi:hypothetical protein